MKSKKIISILLVALLCVTPFSSVGFGASSISHSMDTLSTGLNQSIHVIFGPDGKLYISEYGGGNIVRVDRDGQNKEIFASGLIQPIGMHFDDAGNLYVAEHVGSRVTKIQPDGTKSVINSGLSLLTGLVIDSGGMLYTAEYSSGKILKMNLDGSGATEFVTGLGTSTIIGVTIDSNDNLYVSDRSGGKIRKIAPDGTVTDLITGLATPTWVTFGDDGYLYTSLGTRKIVKYDITGQKLDEYLTPSTIGYPWGTAIDETGYIFYQTLGSASCKIIGIANTIDKTHITLTLNTTLNDATLDPSAFSLSGASLNPTVIQAVASGSNVHLTFDNGISYTDTNLKVSYAKTGVNNVSTLDSTRELDTFIDMPVKNNVLRVTGLSSISNVTVDVGTDLNTVKSELPATLVISISDNTTTSTTVTWDDGTPEYDVNNVGDYIFTGTIATPENVSNSSNFVASVTVTVLSTDATLSEIGLSAGTLEFDANAREYIVNVPNTTDNIIISPIANEANATMAINGSALNNGSEAFNLNVGNNSVVILVTAQNGIATEAYTLTIIRAAATNASLSNLTISSGTLTPEFDSGTTSYSASVSNTVTNLSITPTLSDQTAQVSVNGTLIPSGEASAPIELNVGANEINVLVTAEDGVTTLNYSIVVQRQRLRVEEDDSESPSVETPLAVPKPYEGTVISKVTKTTVDGQTVATVEVDNKIIESKIEEAITNSSSGSTNVLQVPVSGQNVDMIKIQLTGDIVKKLEINAFNVSIYRDNVEYIIPAGELTISKVAESLSVLEEDLQDIIIEIQITNLPQNIVNQFNEIVKANGAELIFPPIAFKVVAKTTRSDGKTEEITINKFTKFVERILELPSSVDPNKVTTGIAFNADGTYNHVPTEIFQKDGKWYAKLSSLTNSSYSLIWNPVTVKSVEEHWSKNAVNEMASRLVVFNPDEFEPDQAITRSDYTEYMVRALGLYRDGMKFDYNFKDVNAVDDRTLGILIANEYGLVFGYKDGTFKPDAFITREEAMVMYQRAMSVSNLVGTNADRYEMYTDYSQVSSWAREQVIDVLSAHVFKGTSATLLSPQKTLTHAEAIQAIKNLLVESGLIND